MRLQLLILLLFSLTCGGCDFLYPLYTAKDVVRQAGLEGTWIEEADSGAGNRWEVSPWDSTGYLLIQHTDSLDIGYYCVLLQLGNKRFADLRRCVGDTPGVHSRLMDTHTFMKINFAPDGVLETAILFPQMLPGATEKGKNAELHYETRPGSFDAGSANDSCYRVDSAAAAAGAQILQQHNGIYAVSEDAKGEAIMTNRHLIFELPIGAVDVTQRFTRRF